MPKDRRHSAIMFTDIVGYTSLMGSNEDRAFEVLSKNREIHQQLVEKYNGTLIKELGDGMLISFNLASDAVYCAIEIQKKCKEQDIPLKVAVNEGELVYEGADVIGDVVNVASRMEADTQEGCITISGKVYSDIKNRKDIQTKFIKEKKFKNVDEPIKVYEVLCKEEAQVQKSSIQDKGGNPKSKKPYYILAGIVVIAVTILFVWKSFPTKKVSDLEKSIAVLPLKYLSEDQSKQYLADGVMDAITGHLSKIDSLIVRPRTSVEQYRETDKTAHVIGEELGVSYLIEGSFLMVENQVMLTIQLLNVKENDHMFFKEYKRDYKDIIAVQSEVAQTVAKEIEVVITPKTKEVIETIPTTNLTAYDFYLKGKEYYQHSTYEEDLKFAIQMYENAVRIDSSFVLAWVGLASSHRRIYWWHFYGNEELIQRTKENLDRAISLSPNLKEVQLEEGSYYYHCHLDYPKALEILEPLKSKYPNDAELNFMIGAVYRRMGNYKKSLEYFKLGISLNPSDYQLWFNTGYTFRVLGEYNDAEKYFKRAIELNPSDHIPYKELLVLYANTGQIMKAREFLIKNQRIIDHPDIKVVQAYIEVLDKNYEKAIQIIEFLSEDAVREQEHYQTKHLQLGLIYHMMSNKEMSVKHFELERDFLLGKMDIRQNDPRLYKSLGIAYAGLGMKKEAIEAGEKALNIRSFSNDVYAGVWTEIDMVKILVMVGEYEDALTRLERIISQHGFITVEELKLDPFWNPIREMDGFKAIINNPEYQVNLSNN